MRRTRPGARSCDIVLVHFPFSSLGEGKVRPALVVSNDRYNRGPDCIAVPFTTSPKSDPYAVEVSDGDLSEGNLHRPSRIRAGRPFTLEQSLILQRLGSLAQSRMAEVRQKLFKTLAQ